MAQLSCPRLPVCYRALRVCMLFALLSITSLLAPEGALGAGVDETDLDDEAENGLGDASGERMGLLARCLWRLRRFHTSAAGAIRPG